jgi:hypothetical protein
VTEPPRSDLAAVCTENSILIDYVTESPIAPAVLARAAQTARTLKFEIPARLLATADEVIE